ncbi:MAG: hypothetical protein ACXWNZ_02270 [Vulcanimicrobiaceae bacterium]
MLNLRKVAAVTTVLAAFATGTGAAQSTSAGIVDAPSRFSGPGVYPGAPALPVTLSMVEAGGGPSDFSSLKLIGVLAGKNTDAEVAKLTKQYGKDQVAQFVTTFNFVVDDSLKIATAKGVKLPATPNPDPNNGEALAGALWSAGQTARGFNVEVMLDRAVSHPIHVQVMKDIDAKYGLAADAQYHAILTTAMKDLAAAYSLNAQGKMTPM